MRDNSVSCEALQRALGSDRELRGEWELTVEEAEHLKTCDACLDASLTTMSECEA